jgi:hypothetical protein
MCLYCIDLSDVEEGGETYFPDLDIAVKPKRYFYYYYYHYYYYDHNT